MTHKLKINITFIFLIIAVMYFVFIGSVLHGQVTPQVNQNTRIVAFGDSLVVGVGSTSGNDFVGVLSERLGIPITKVGTSGLTTASALTVLDSQVISLGPDIVILVLGGNDILQNLPQSQMIDNLRTIIQNIQNSGSRVILVAVHGQLFQNNFETIFSNLAVETGASYVPNVLNGIIGNPLYMSDLVHPNDRGYEIMADRIFPVLQTTINSLPSQNLSATCSPSRTTSSTNQTVTWTAFATGGIGNYTYLWSGTDGLQGSGSMSSISYSSGGQKSGTVIVTSGNTSVTVNCGETVTVTQPALLGSCSVSANSTQTGYILNFTSTTINGTGTTTTYTWTGTDGLVGNSQAITKEYTTTGQKNATLTIQSGNQTLSLTCGASIDPINTATTTRFWNGGCSSSASGRQVNWNTFSPYNYTYSWEGTDGLTATSSTIQKIYESDGVKSATVSIQNGGENNYLTCQTAVSNVSGGGCFIATAAFGTPLDPHVVTLRKFRDEKLLTTSLGTEFVQTYYKYSPPIAHYIETREHLKSFVRVGLWPIVLLAEKL